PPPRDLADGHVFRDDALEIVLPIEHDGDRLGTLFLRSDLSPISERRRHVASVLAGVFCASGLRALVPASRPPGRVSRPVDPLPLAARAVTRRQDYSVRAVRASDDEVGELIDAFNEMLSQIERRDRELEGSRDHLEEQVATRTRELTKVNEQLVAAKEA